MLSPDPKAVTRNSDNAEQLINMLVIRGGKRGREAIPRANFGQLLPPSEFMDPATRGATMMLRVPTGEQSPSNQSYELVTFQSRTHRTLRWTNILFFSPL